MSGDELLYLSKADVENLDITMGEVVAAVERGFLLKGERQASMPPKLGLDLAEGFFHAMPAAVAAGAVSGVEGGVTGEQGPLPAAGGTAVVKWVSAFPNNPTRGLPAINGLLILSDSHTGQPLAVMDCAWLTAMRTGASVGVAAKHLARAEARSAAVIGCGVQGRTSLRALVEVLPELRAVHCVDVSDRAREAFMTEMTSLFPRLRMVPSPAAGDAVEQADVTVTAVPMARPPRPVIGPGALRPGCLVVSLDYDAAVTPEAIAVADKVVCDDAAQLLATRAQGVYLTEAPAALHADLGEVAAGAKPGRESQDERIVCLNLGIAVADAVTAALVYERARAQGVGARLPL